MRLLLPSGAEVDVLSYTYREKTLLVERFTSWSIYLDRFSLVLYQSIIVSSSN